DDVTPAKRLQTGLCPEPLEGFAAPSPPRCANFLTDPLGADDVEWEAIYREAWSLYYTPEHMRTLMRRAAATGVPMGSLLKVLVSFATTVRLENVHPLQSGVLRLKHPSERRPGLPRERIWVFWPRFVWETLYKHVILAGVIARLFVSKIS